MPRHPAPAHTLGPRTFPLYIKNQHLWAAQAPPLPGPPLFQALRPPYHPHGFLPAGGQHPNAAGLAMNTQAYAQPYDTLYCQPMYPPHVHAGPGYFQPWEPAPGHFLGHPPPVPYPVATHPGPDNFGVPVEGMHAAEWGDSGATTPVLTQTQAVRTKTYVNMLIGKGGRWHSLGSLTP